MTEHLSTFDLDRIDGMAGQGLEYVQLTPEEVVSLTDEIRAHRKLLYGEPGEIYGAVLFAVRHDDKDKDTENNVRLISEYGDDVTDAACGVVAAVIQTTLLMIADRLQDDVDDYVDKQVPNGIMRWVERAYQNRKDYHNHR